MKVEKLMKITLSLIGMVGLCSILGCVSKERVVTYEVTKSGKDWVENETIQERRGPDGKLKIEKQFIYEKVKCVGKKGKQIKAVTPEECIEQGGKVIDVTVVEEQTIKRK